MKLMTPKMVGAVKSAEKIPIDTLGPNNDLKSFRLFLPPCGERFQQHLRIEKPNKGEEKEEKFHNLGDACLRLFLWLLSFAITGPSLCFSPVHSILIGFLWKFVGANFLSLSLGRQHNFSAISLCSTPRPPETCSRKRGEEREEKLLLRSFLGKAFFFNLLCRVVLRREHE
jgi:hypothetical protein